MDSLDVSVWGINERDFLRLYMVKNMKNDYCPETLVELATTHAREIRVKIRQSNPYNHGFANCLKWVRKARKMVFANVILRIYGRTNVGGAFTNWNFDERDNET